MLVDTGFSADILYLQAYDKLGLSRKHLKPVATPLTGFTGHSIHPMGITELDVTMGQGSRVITVRASFTVVNIADPSYNGLIGRPLLTALRAIVSPVYLKMKFLTLEGVGEMMGDQKRGCECYQSSQSNGTTTVKTLRVKRGEPHEDLETIAFNEARPDRVFNIGTRLSEGHQRALKP
ncbi:hypothetical protein LIER_03934 [Lithospermum erythrorhizon]|uniref:Peptidase A2 domain-containing protein n=1 Tax=Lithospermum erythrorhizon TaxID=34254 RepID=A0AAV3NVM9_LITER